MPNALLHSLYWLKLDGNVNLDDVGRPEQLDHVGLVVWQSAFVLAEYLLRHPPFGQWSDVRVVDLGTGTGELRVQASLRASK